MCSQLVFRPGGSLELRRRCTSVFPHDYRQDGRGRPNAEAQTHQRSRYLGSEPDLAFEAIPDGSGRAEDIWEKSAV